MVMLTVAYTSKGFHIRNDSLQTLRKGGGVYVRNNQGKKFEYLKFIEANMTQTSLMAKITTLGRTKMVSFPSESDSANDNGQI
jgi:hypothetical protein